MDSSDKVYIKSGDRIVRVEDGFESEDDVEKYIEEELTSGDYEYGVLSENGTKTVEESEPETKDLTQKEIARMDQIFQIAEDNDKVQEISQIERMDQRFYCSVNCQNIAYTEGEPDFRVKIDPDIFDEPPVSTIDWSVESEIRDIFNEIANGVATFLGYDSSYASRGRRDPYVMFYGRVHREDEKVIRVIEEKDYTACVYRSSENLSPIPLYMMEENEGYKTQDYVIVLDMIGDDSYEEISNGILIEVERILNDLDELNANIQYEWVGKTSYKRNFYHIAIGISV